ncbi:MAG: tetratricopeptide repeat protein, partial [Victivallales bacterium]
KLGELYLSRDPGKAFEWFAKAAEEHWNVYSSSRSWAQLRIGKCHMNGTGVPKNEKKSWEWLAKAAANGNGEARVLIERYAKKEQCDAKTQCDIGWFYLNGTDFAKDEKKALEWLGRAATQGYTRAIGMIEGIKAGKEINAF